MKPVIPLVADGLVFAYACGGCMHIRLGGERLGYPSNSEEKLKRVTETAEWSRELAESCCTCHMCHVDLTEKQRSRWGFDGMLCDDCLKKDAARQAKIGSACDRYLARRKASLEKSPNPDAAENLFGLMEDISEDRFCAGWLDGLEYMLWPPELGDHDPDKEQLRLLSEKAGGWWIWSAVEEDLGNSGEIFVPADEWAASLQKKQSKVLSGEPTTGDFR